MDEIKQKVMEMLFDYLGDPESVRGEYREKVIEEYRAEEIR